MALKILLADDSMTAQNMGKKILTDAGYEVVAVSNGAAAVKKIAEISPHLCILDIYMPGYTGLEVCEKVKSSSATARMPVLLTVGKMEPYKPEEGARVRADGVIVKPFEASELLRAVHRFSQRVAGAHARPPMPAAPSPPASTPATYERTVKLTREQIQEYMEPAMPNWQGGTTGSDVAVSAAAHTPMEVANVVATTKMASTADDMPTFAVTAVAEQDPPAALAVAPEIPAMAGLAVATLPATATTDEPAAPNASAVLPGFVDYLIAQPTSAAIAVPPPAETPAGGDFPKVDSTAENVEPPPESPQFSSVATVKEEFAIAASSSASSEEISVPAPVQSPEPTPMVARAVDEIGYKIPAVDPALEVAPDVAVQVTPDPQFEAVQEIPVDNATEAGLQPTSRAAESEGVVAAVDPNLSPMDSLSDAVKPLEGGRLVVSEEVAAPTLPVAEPAAQTPIVSPLPESPESTGRVPGAKKSKKNKEMRPIALASSNSLEPGAPVAESATAARDAAAAVAEPAALDNAIAAEVPKTDVSEEIAAVLDLLGQTTASVVNPPPGASALASPALSEEPIPPSVMPSGRIWMAEEVALSESEASISLENEMRIAYAPKEVEPEFAAVHDVRAAEPGSLPEVVATAPAEEPVRDDKHAPKPAINDPGASAPPEVAPSPTQELAAAMAAAFGGALPQEDLARAEETQSISEEVRRFALGDAYKPKPTFAGAAVDQPGEKVVNNGRLAAAVERALDRLKPQLIAEILKELEDLEEN